MRTLHNTTGLPSVWVLLLIAVLAACGSDSSDGKTVAVNLSLVMDGRQAQHRAPLSRLFAWFEQWFPGAAPAWAQQAVTDITRINVQISGPGIPTAATADVPVTDPASGKEIPVTIQAPVGPNRTITVAAFNAANAKIFGGTVPNVNLTAGAPIDLVVTLVQLFTVNVRKEGTGSGTVTSSPPGIDCGSTCSSQFEQGTSVSLTAPAAPGSAFAGWGGDCSGTGGCTVTRESTVIARFIVAASTNHLHVDRGGTGTGTVTSEPNGISCGVTCDADFTAGTIVRLTASAAPGSTFSSWSGGGCSGGAPTCDVGMTVNQNVAAIFMALVPPPMSTLIVQKSGSGSGTVTSAPIGINCGGTCSAQFPTDNTVTLTATAASGSTFVGWSGACSGLSCSVAMNTDQTVSAQFDLLPVFVTLTVTKSGRGTGTVTDNTGAVVCGVVCQATYLQGTEITLTATPDLGSTFNEWRRGPCNNDRGQCVLTMDRDRTEEANFDLVGGGGGPGG